MALNSPKHVFGESSLRPTAPPFQPKQHSQELVITPTNDEDEPAGNRDANSPGRGPPDETHEEAAKSLKLSVLAPFFNRIIQDGEENLRLWRLKAELATMNERQRKQLAGLREEDEESNGEQLLLEAPEPRGAKRKATHPSPMKMGMRETGGDEHTVEGHLLHLANQICKDLDETVPNEKIYLCGLGPLKIMESRPDEVLDLAHQKLHTWPYKNVPMCWRRLYEDASLSKAETLIRDEAERIGNAVSFKRRRLNGEIQSPILALWNMLLTLSVVESFNAEQTSSEWMTELVTVLDKGITLTGTPGRAAVFEGVFQQLDNYLKDGPEKAISTRWIAFRQRQLDTQHPIARTNKAMNFEAFQHHLDRKTTPIIIPDTMTTWPALSLWQNPTYLMRVTLGGRRLVPVEVGKSYLDDDWSQRMMTFREFMTDFLLPEEPKDVGYLAQHDLFAQIPSLKNDISTPDYCYTSPPDPDEAASRTPGLSSVSQLDEPLLNAWLGPKGTKTPLHTDPYHNILCQVVGYKYVRLYGPTETPNLYPCGVDDNGIDMSNTSQADISRFRSTSLDKELGVESVNARMAEQQNFPRVGHAKFVEGILGPGECLYIPLGWWHYVESLSTSFSVSFWWN